MRNRRGIFLIPAVTVLMTLAAALSAVAAQTAAEKEPQNRKTVLNGVFTAAQAERGKEAYAVHCSSCHMADLQGVSAPALKGEQFMDNWREDSLKSLFSFIQTNMPANRARGSLSDETYIDILAHILSVNMFPAGPSELSFDALGAIDLVGMNGPAPIPKFALVTMVGCLAKMGDEWGLLSASSPARTRQEKPTGSEVRASAARPLGTGTFRLVYIDSLRPVFLPEQYVGQKLHAQGYLLSNEKGEGLSVTWLEAVAQTCMK
jgi:S-disulfanyl-L-cysteine oxidoreductase SoxD